MPDKDKSLERFIEKVIEIQNSKSKTYLDTDGLKKVAVELGMTNNEWQRLQETFDDHFVRGRGFLKYENFTDAIIDLEQALSINPHHVNTLFLLSKAYYIKWQHTNNEADKLKVEQYAKKCLQIEPTHNDSLRIISSLKVKPKRPPKKINTPVALVAVLILVLLGGVFFALFYTQSAPQVNEIAVPDSKTTAETSEPEKEQVTIINEFEPPITFVKNSKSDGLILIPESSQFDDYTSSYNYKMAADMEISKYEINYLKLRVELIDDKGDARVMKDIEPIKKYRNPVRDGDVTNVHFSEYVKNKMPDFKEIRITAVAVERIEAASGYQPSENIDFEWGISKPANFNIEVRERLNSISGSASFQSHKLELEVENKGNIAIHQLKFRIDWLKNNEVIDSKEIFATVSLYATIKRGQTKLCGGTWSVKPFDSYKITVVSIE